MIDLDLLLSKAHTALKLAKDRGAEEVEVYVGAIETKEAVIHNNKLMQSSTAFDSGIGIRVVLGRRIGYSYTNSLDDKEVEKAVERALASARSVPEDIHWKGLPRKMPPQASDIYSSKLAEVDIVEIVKIVAEMLTLAIKDPRITVVYGGLSVNNGVKAVVNSEGVEAFSRGTSALMSIELVANESGDTTPSIMEFKGSRTDIPDHEKVVGNAVRKALSSLHPVKVDRPYATAIFTQLALEELLTYTLMVSMRADAVATGRSYLMGKLGAKVFSDELTVIDDGTLEGGLYTESYDDEGVPRRRTVLIDRGVVKNFIADTYWGRRIGGDSTGNASRAGYASPVRVDYTNLVISPGTRSSEDLLNEIEYGLLVDCLQGAHSSNPESGEFSVVAAPAWLVSRGELKPVRGVMLAGNIYQLLKDNIYAVCNNVEQTFHLVAPWIAFRDVRVIQR